MSDEREISIVELLAACVRNAKKIIIFAIILALLAGAYQVYSQHNSLVASAGKLLEVEDVSAIPDWRAKVDEILYNEYLEKKDNYEETKVNYDQQLDNLQDRIEYQRAYIAESLRMKLDPYNVSETTIYFSICDIDPKAYEQAFGQDVTPLDYVIGKIVTQYQNFWNRSTLHDSLALSEYAEVEDKYIRELVSFSNYGNGTMRITAIGESQEASARLADAAYKLVTDNVKTVSGLSYNHKLELVSEDSMTQIDNSLLDQQEAAYQSLEDYKVSIDKLNAEIIKLSASAPQAPSQENKMAIIKFILIGGVAGGVLACAWYVCAYLFNGKLGSSAQLQSYFNMSTLGNVSKEKGMFDRWAYAMCDEKIWKDESTALDYISDKADLLCQGRKKVLILSSLAPDPELAAKLKKSIAGEGRETLFADDASHNPKAMELLKSCDSVVLAESLRKTKLSDIERIKKLAEMTEKHIDGVVLF